MSDRTLAIGVAQFELKAEQSVDGFLAHLESVIAPAVAAGAELVVLPELASMGLLAATHDRPTTATIGAAMRDLLAPLWGEIAAGIGDLAAAHGVSVLGGTHCRVADDGSLRNTAILAHPDRSIVLQDKLHLTPQERHVGMVGGDDVMVARVGPMRVGILICADIQIPELGRHLGANGVDLVLNPSLTWNRRGVFRVRNGAHARASENQVFVAVSPLVGASGLPRDAPLHAVGGALVCCPVDRTFGRNDGVLAASVEPAEHALVVDLDLNVLAASRANPEIPGVKLQRPELYEQLRDRRACG